MALWAAQLLVGGAQLKESLLNLSLRLRVRCSSLCNFDDRKLLIQRPALPLRLRAQSLTPAELVDLLSAQAGQGLDGLCNLLAQMFVADILPLERTPTGGVQASGRLNFQLFRPQTGGIRVVDLAAFLALVDRAAWRRQVLRSGHARAEEES